MGRLQESRFIGKSLFLSLIISIFAVSTTLASGNFKDYDPNKFWSEAMSWAAEQKIITGVEKGTDRYLMPNSTLTESEFIVMLFRYGSPELMKKYAKEGDNWTRVPYLLAKGAGVKADKTNAAKKYQEA